MRLETVGVGLPVAKQRLPRLPTKMTGRKRTAIGPLGHRPETSAQRARRQRDGEPCEIVDAKRRRNVAETSPAPVCAECSSFTVYQICQSIGYVNLSIPALKTTVCKSRVTKRLSYVCISYATKTLKDSKLRHDHHVVSVGVGAQGVEHLGPQRKQRSKLLNLH